MRREASYTSYHTLLHARLHEYSGLGIPRGGRGDRAKGKWQILGRRVFSVHVVLAI